MRIIGILLLILINFHGLFSQSLNEIVLEGDINRVREKLDADKELVNKSWYGATPLHTAIDSREFDIVNLILGYDPNLSF